MDATASGNGFDAALKALDDLETSVAETRESAPAEGLPAAPVAPVLPIAPIAPVAPAAPVAIAAIAFGEGEEPDEPQAITASPVVETQVAAPAPPIAAAPAAEAAAPPAEPAADAPIAAVAAPAAKSGLLGKMAIGAGLLSSVLSVAGLLVAERTIMSAQLVVADARERQQQLEQSTALIHDLQIVRDKQIELLKAQQAQLVSAPVTSDELQHRMEALQASLVKRDPITEVVSAIQSGQSDTYARLNEIGTKIDRLGASGSGGN